MDNAISPAAVRKVTRELYAILDDPPEGIRLILNEDSITDIQAWILGPEGTPYEGGCFRIRIQLSPDFPNSPPKCYFLTKIFHPNVSPQGDVCVNTLKKDWKKELGIRHILLVVKCLLIVPNPESALNEEAGRQLLVRYEDYAKHARIMTEIHAQAPRKEIFPAVQPSSAVSDGKAESEKTDAASVVPMAVDSPKVEIQNEDNRKTPSASDTANEGSSEKHQHSVVSAKSTTLTTTMAPSSSSPSTSALLTNSSVPSMASPTLESSSTLSRLNNSCIPCPMRSHKKRKLSTDEQQQHPSQSTLSVTTALNKAADTLSTTTITTATAGSAIASMNHTHAIISTHLSSKPTAQQQYHENKLSSRGSVSHHHQPILPGPLQTGGYENNSHDLGSFLQRDYWPTTTLTGLTTSHSPMSSQYATAMPLDQGKKRSLRRL